MSVRQWTVHTVHNKAQLIAAIRASAVPVRNTPEWSPVCIRLGRTRYTFKDGITDESAQRLAREIRRTPARVFAVATEIEGGRDGE